MKSRYLVVMSFVMALAACTKESKSSPDQTPLVPASLGFTKPAVGPELTAAQIAEMKATLKSKSMMQLPPGELIFPNENADPAETQRKEEQLRNTDPNSYALLQEMRGNCGKGHPNIKFDATFPTDNVTGENAFDILQVGDHATFSGAMALTNLANCPIDAAASAGAGAEVKDVNSHDRSGAAAANTGGKLKFVMKNPKYAELLGARGIIVDSNVSGVVVHREVNGKHDDGLITFAVNGSYLSLKADIPYDIQFKILGRQDNEQSGSTEAVFTATFKYPTFTATLVGHVDTSGAQPVKEYFLNGRPVTEEELTRLFGDQIPGEATQRTMKAML